MRRVGWLALAVSLVASLWFTALSLARWEWNRALFFGLVVVSTEVATGVSWVLLRLSRLERRLEEGAAEDRVLAELRRTRPQHRRFAWLDPTEGRTNVFITLLVGGGVLVSALAWAIDQVASRTTTRAAERDLARDLRAIRYPDDGLLVDEVAALAHDLPYLDDPQLRRLLRRPGHTP